MGLAYRPHTATVQDPSDVSIGTNLIVGTDFADGFTLRGQLTPLTPSLAFEKWGIELERPHEFLSNVSDGQNVKEGFRMVISDRTFTVKTKMLWDAEPITSHIKFLLEEIGL